MMQSGLTVKAKLSDLYLILSDAYGFPLYIESRIATGVETRDLQLWILIEVILESWLDSEIPELIFVIPAY